LSSFLLLFLDKINCYLGGEIPLNKEAMVGVRLTEEELERLDRHTKQLSRAQILRILVQGFLAKSEKEQRKLLVDHLFEQPDE